MQKYIVHAQKFTVWIAPYLERYISMIKRNIWYILWFIVYFNLSMELFWPVLWRIFKMKSLFAGFMIYGISIFIALLFGDVILGLIEGARILETKKEKTYLNPIFEEVYQDIKEIYPSLPKMRLHIIDSLTINACAIGNHTVAVTQGAVETFNSEELKGIFAHEMSHIYHGDTKAILLNTIGNGIFTILTIIIKLIIRGMEYLAMIFESTVMQAVFNLFRFIFELVIFLFLWLGKFILSFNSRGNELRADKFAYETGGMFFMVCDCRFMAVDLHA